MGVEAVAALVAGPEKHVAQGAAATCGPSDAQEHFRSTELWGCVKGCTGTGQSRSNDLRVVRYPLAWQWQWWW